jgi:hypothetical protein
LEFFIPVSGQLDDENMSDEWEFMGTAGLPISLVARTIQGSLDPVLVLLDSEETLLASNDDSAFGDSSARLEGFILPADGRYVVRVYREGLERGTTQGEYELRLLEGSGSEGFTQTGYSVRVWLNTQTPNHHLILPELPTPTAYYETQITASVRGAEVFSLTWDLGDWRFSWDSTGQWMLGQTDGNDHWLANITGLADSLNTQSLNATLRFILQTRQIQVMVDNHLVAEYMAEETPSVDNLGVAVNFALQNTLEYAPSLTIQHIYTAERYYPESEHMVALPPLEPNQRLYTYQDNPLDIIGELRGLNLIPTGGGLTNVLEDGYVYTYQLGFSAYPLLEDKLVGDFVMGFEAIVTEGAESTACGLLFRQADGENFATALISPRGEMYFLNYIKGDLSEGSLSFRTPFVRKGLRQINYIQVVAIGRQGTLFINGRQIGQIPLTTSEGRLLAQLVLDTEIQAFCLLQDIWLWEWRGSLG